MNDTPKQPLTPEEEAELQKAREEFVKDYGDLVQKHQVDFAQYPVYVPDGNGGFRTVIQNTPVSIKNQPKKSPFVAEK